MVLNLSGLGVTEILMDLLEKCLVLSGEDSVWIHGVCYLLALQVRLRYWVDYGDCRDSYVKQGYHGGYHG